MTINPEISKKVEAVANRVINQAQVKNSNEFGAIVTILMVISIILTAIRIIQECNKKKTFGSFGDKRDFYSEQIHKHSRQPGWFVRRTIKQLVRKELPPESYKDYGPSLVDAIFVIGADLTDDETQALVEAANV